MARIETQDSKSASLAIAERELDAGERLVWADQPRPWALARRDLPTALFGIPFTAFAVFWIYGASQATQRPGALQFFPLFGLPFVAVGLVLLCFPIWSALRARCMVYAITDRRLMIVERYPARRITSYTAGDIQAIERTERPDGSGDVVFRRELSYQRRAYSSSFGASRRIGFFGVSEARRVEEEIRRLAQAGAKVSG